jgi:hypothetical protein
MKRMARHILAHRLTWEPVDSSYNLDSPLVLVACQLDPSHRAPAPAPARLDVCEFEFQLSCECHLTDANRKLRTALYTFSEKIDRHNTTSVYSATRHAYIVLGRNTLTSISHLQADGKTRGVKYRLSILLIISSRLGLTI